MVLFLAMIEHQMIHIILVVYHQEQMHFQERKHRRLKRGGGRERDRERERDRQRERDTHTDTVQTCMIYIYIQTQTHTQKEGIGRDRDRERDTHAHGMIYKYVFAFIYLYRQRRKQQSNYWRVLPTNAKKSTRTSHTSISREPQDIKETNDNKLYILYNPCSQEVKRQTLHNTNSCSNKHAVQSFSQSCEAK